MRHAARNCSGRVLSRNHDGIRTDRAGDICPRMAGKGQVMFGKKPYQVNALSDLLKPYPQQPQGWQLQNALLGAGQPNPQQQAPAQQQPKQPDYGNRVDGTPKGRGFLGEIKTPDGRIMTEYSVGVDWGEGEMEIPSVVPGLTPDEIQYLAAGNDPTDAIIDKAIDHAIERRRKGLSPFATSGQDYE